MSLTLPDADSPNVVTRFRLNDQVAATIREEILSGTLRPGTRMVQSEWAERLGTSRMPVRDAILRLQSEGLIVSFASGIAQVAALSEEDIRDAYVLNSVAAGMAAKRAAERMSEETIKQLRALQATFEEAVGRDDVATAQKANNGFHRMLTVESHSPRLIGMIRILSSATPHVGTRQLPRWRERSVAVHGEILEAVEKRQGDVVERLMSEHVLEAADVVIAYLRERGFWSEGS